MEQQSSPTLEKPEVSSMETTQSFLDELMSGYSAPAKKVEETPVATNAQPTPLQSSTGTQPTAQPQQASPVDPEAPYGRYQRGKKKGQPRTAPFISVKAGVTQPTQVVVQPQTAKLSGMLIDGGLFLTLINIAVPLLIAILNNYVEKDKKKHIDPQKLKLTNDQKKELDPVVDAVMKQVSLTGNPLVILLVGLLTAYGLNFMALKMEVSNK